MSGQGQPNPRRLYQNNNGRGQPGLQPQGQSNDRQETQRVPDQFYSQSPPVPQYQPQSQQQPQRSPPRHQAPPPQRQPRPQQNGAGAGVYSAEPPRGRAPNLVQAGMGASGFPMEVTMWSDGPPARNGEQSYLPPDGEVPTYITKEGMEAVDMAKYRQQRKRRESRGAEAKPMTVDEAFRSIKAGVSDEDEGRYTAAMRNFLEAGEMLAAVADMETERHIKTLLHAKAAEVLQWTEALADWIDQGERGPPPRRFGRTVPVSVSGRNRGLVMGANTYAGPEFDTMYYTSVSTKKVVNFTQDGYRLQCVKNGRFPKLMVVITMYNEDENELNGTLRKVANNTKNIQKHRLPGYEGDDAWHNILVCVVSDGRTKANKGTLKFLADVGAFDEDAMTINSAGVDVQMHLFEYSMQMMNHKRSHDLLGLSDDRNETFPPMQIVFALKEHNAGKLTSHEWYFNAFANQVNPEYTVLLDVGTMPTKTAFYRLLTTMEVNKQIGGVCGEIAVDKPIPHLYNFVIAAQHFEYKISNLLDKALESSFGFISVLPGAFSAYRFEAIKGAPLQAYFKSLTTSPRELGPFQGNMYLAEDRILCFELLAKKGSNWTMHYVKNAIARTDVPTDLVALIGQRRRWLNGSFFAILYTILYWGRVYTESNHSLLRKLFLFLQYCFMVITVILNWLLVANFFLAIYYVVVVGFMENTWRVSALKTQEIPVEYKAVIQAVFLGLYALSLVTLLILGMGNKPKHVSMIYKVISVYYALLMILSMAITFIIMMSSLTQDNGSGKFNYEQVVAIIIVFGVFFIAAALHCELHHILFSFFQYFMLLPTMVNILTMYSFCNLHDLSWGTKGLDTATDHGAPKEGGKGKYADVVAAQKAAEAKAKAEAAEKDLLEKSFSGFRSRLLLAWLVSQMVFIFIMVKVDPLGDVYLAILFFIVAAFNLFRFMGSVSYLLYHGWTKMVICCCVRSKMRTKERKNRAAAARGQHYTGMATPTSRA